MTSSAQNTVRRRAFVTGVSGGIGAAITELLLSHGWEVWGTSRSAKGWAAFADQSGFTGLRLDLDDRPGALAGFAESMGNAGGFELIINNAGYGVFSPLAQTSAAVLEQQLVAMINNTAALIGEQVKLLRSQNAGTLVNVSSLAVEFPLPFMPGYNMAKAALSALSESLMMESAGTGITVIDFRPGDIKTDFNRVMAARAQEVIADSDSDNVGRAWETLEANVAAAPAPDHAAAVLWRALGRGRSGIVRCGGIFQARIAPVLIRLIPERWARAIRWSYFGLKSGG